MVQNEQMVSHRDGDCLSACKSPAVPSVNHCVRVESTALPWIERIGDPLLSGRSTKPSTPCKAMAMATAIDFSCQEETAGTNLSEEQTANDENALEQK